MRCISQRRRLPRRTRIIRQAHRGSGRRGTVKMLRQWLVCLLGNSDERRSEYRSVVFVVDLTSSGESNYSFGTRSTFSFQFFADELVKLKGAPNPEHYKTHCWRPPMPYGCSMRRRAVVLRSSCRIEVVQATLCYQTQDQSCVDGNSADLSRVKPDWTIFELYLQATYKHDASFGVRS